MHRLKVILFAMAITCGCVAIEIDIDDTDGSDTAECTVNVDASVNTGQDDPAVACGDAGSPATVSTVKADGGKP